MYTLLYLSVYCWKKECCGVTIKYLDKDHLWFAMK